MGPAVSGGEIGACVFVLSDNDGRTEEQRQAIRQWTIQNHGSIHRYILGAVPADA